MVVLLGLLAPADARGRGVDEEAVGLPGRLTPAEDRGRGVDEDGVGAGCEEQAARHTRQRQLPTRKRTMR